MIVILNGPPNVGKDTLADNLVKTTKDIWQKCSFKEKLYYDVANYYSVDVSWFKTIATNRVTKEIKFTELGYISPREAMIYVSEEIIKPTYGKDHYGQYLAEIINNIAIEVNIVIADGGFEEELIPMFDEFDSEVIIVQMFEDNCNFDNDSRDYIEGWPDKTYRIDVTKGNPIEDLHCLENIIEEHFYGYIFVEPDDTPYMTEDFEGGRHYIGEENE